MSYINDSLSTGEEVQAVFKLHWCNWVMIVIFSFTIILIPIALWSAIQLITREFGLTNRRLIFKKGIVSRHSDEMKLSSIETVTIEQGFIGRILGYGNVQITGKGISDVVFESIDEPLEVKKKIESIAAEAAHRIRPQDVDED